MHSLPGSHSATHALDGAAAWGLLRALSACGDAHLPQHAGIALDARGSVSCVAPGAAWVFVRHDLESGYAENAALDDEARELLTLHMPLCVGARARDLVIAHLGQSLDGRVATGDPQAKFITGARDILHTHHLRALFDAVVVGAGTIAADDPLLTTRLCSGPNPVRVVLDPDATLSPTHKVFRQEDARTLVVTCESGAAVTRPAHVSTLCVPRRNGKPHLAAMLHALHDQGLHRIYIEGGGVTIARFLQAGLLDRLQLAIAPKRLGPGDPSLALPLLPWLDRRTRFRRLRLGQDVLYDARFERRSTASAHT